MSEKQTVYRIRYTVDDRIRSVHVTEEPRVGWIAAAGWWLVWL